MSHTESAVRESTGVVATMRRSVGTGGVNPPWPCYSLWNLVVFWGWATVLTHVILAVEGAVGELVPWNATCPRRCTCSYRGSTDSLPISEHRSTFRTTDCANRKLHNVPVLPRNTEVLLLRGNGITTLHDRLTTLNQLRMVDLSHNNIETLGSHPSFENLTSLHILNLEYNRIHSLLHACFHGMASLHTLYLANNHIQSIEDHSFDGLKALQVLDLTSNELVSVSRHWFDALPKLRELVIDNNQLSSLNSAPFLPLQALTKLSLQNNPLRRLSKNTFRGLEGLQNLNLGYNMFEKVPTRAFTVFKRLKYLSLDGNPLTMLADKDFRDFSVEEMSVSYLPELSIVDAAAFYNLPDLETLQLHDNPRLGYVDDEAFILLPHLKALNVHNDNLRSLPPSVPLSLPALRLVNLVDNPLLCDCNVHWVKMANLTQTNHSGVVLVDADRLRCDGPAAMSGRLLRDVLLEDLSVTCAPTAVPFFNVSYQRQLGDSITYECRAVGITRPHIHWLLSNGKAVNNTSNFSRVRLAARGSLQIEHLKPQDAGTYTCVATNDNGYDTVSTVLLIHSNDIHVILKGESTNFITVTWNGTDSTMSTSKYLLLYRRVAGQDGGQDSSQRDEDYGRVYLMPYMRAYTITNLLPQTWYEFCIAYEHMEQVVSLHCIEAQTKHRMYMMQGIKTLGNMTIVIALTVTLSAIVVFCLGVTAVRRYRRRKSYQEPEGDTLCPHSTTEQQQLARSRKLGHMSQIPLDNLYHPPSTPICTSRTSLIGHAGGATA